MVAGNDIQLAIAVQISEENAIETPASRRDFRDDARPTPAPNNAPWILQIEKMARLVRHDGIGKPVAVQVADRDIRGRAGFGALGERDPKPLVGIFETERCTDMIAFFVDRDDVDMAVFVEGPRSSNHLRRAAGCRRPGFRHQWCAPPRKCNFRWATERGMEYRRRWRVRWPK